MQRSDSIKELATALAKAQGEIENASKNQKNDHYKNRYADLAEVLNTIRPVFAANGLSVVQFPSYEQPMAHVETVLMHSSGEFMSHVCSAPVNRADAQGVGSAVTYLRRYSLAAVAGIAQEDDDAAGAGGNNGGNNQQRQPQAEKPAKQDAPKSYSYEQFEANLPTWTKLIQTGKRSHDEIISTVETKAPMTDEQKKKIRAIPREQPAQQGA